MDMLKVSGVSKTFGKHKIIDNLSFTVPEHTVYGFIGQNGAGKTTTMKMILGLYSIDEGNIFVNEKKVNFGETATNKYIGYLPDVPDFYSYMTPLEYLEMCGCICGMDKQASDARAKELLEMVGLEKADKRIKGFSRGMKQRLGIAQALINRPKLLICDEPTSALDPVGRKEILEILLNVKEQTTVVFSTHILSDVERICDRIGLLNNGRLSLDCSMEDIRAKHSEGFEIEFITNKELDIFINKMACETEYIKLSDTKLVYKQSDKDVMEKAMIVLCKEHIVPKKFEMLEPTLESLFMKVVGE